MQNIGDEEYENFFTLNEILSKIQKFKKLSSSKMPNLKGVDKVK